MSAVLFQNVRLIDPAGGVDGLRHVLAGGGIVERVAETISVDEAMHDPAGAERLDLLVVNGEGLWMWPGLVDPHVHFREPGFTEKETFRTGGLAAAAGGYTTVICEPNTSPPLDSAERIRRAAAQAEREAVVHVYFKAAMTKERAGAEPVDVAALANEPAVVALSDDGDPIVAPSLVERVCSLAARAGLLVAPHCEDSVHALEQTACGLSPGFEPGEPYTNEANYVERDGRLAAKAGCRIHFSHVSLARSVHVVEELRADTGQPAHATYEATPHHVLLCRDDYPPAMVPRVNPPLRSREDMLALREALVRGRVDAIASDHAPHTAEDKAAGAPGLIGLETTLGLVLTRFLGAGGLSVGAAVRLLSLSPARIFGVPGGTLAPGSPADIVLIDPSREWTVEAEHFNSKARNTPFEGQALRGRAVATYVAGAEVFCGPDFDERKNG